MSGELAGHAAVPAWPARIWRMVVWSGCAVFHTAAFPPFDLPESAYVFAVAATLWSMRQPGWKNYLFTTGSAFLVSWLVILAWMRELVAEGGPIAYVGWVALSAVAALFPLGWCAGLRWAVPRVRGADALARCLVFAGLAGLWVVLEWIRSWLLTGFPWLPLAASQWQRPVMLQGAAYGGAWAISFALVFFNLGLAAYLERLHLFVRTRRSRLCPEFYLGLVVLFAVSFGLYGDAVGQEREPLLRAGAMQPDIPQTAKWDPASEREILGVLATETRRLAKLEPDAVFWPEAVLPIVLPGSPEMEQWIEGLAREIGRPIVLGAVGYSEAPAGREGGPPVEIWTNGVVVVDPVGGLSGRRYAKRHLVPFGEYVPLRRILPFMEKIVPIGGDFTPGKGADSVFVRTPRRTVQTGALICYEDVFPGLARASARAGAQMLFVATNNGWFGRGAAAYQHAAHSVMRAVETRRPVLRVGNAGWSGWIDEYGLIRDRMVDDRGSIYHRGSTVFPISRDRRWAGRESLYVRWGDWLVGVSVLLVAAGGWAAHREGAPKGPTR